MKLKCRICKAEVAQGVPGDDNALKKHLEQHRWQILRLIQGTEGDGTFARFLESLMFEMPDDPELGDITDFLELQQGLFNHALNADAVDSNLKGAPLPQKGSGR